MTDFTIEILTTPASIDAPDAADFIEMTRVRNDVKADTFGSHELDYAPAELLPHWQNPYQPQVGLVARVDGRIVGRAVYELTLEDGSTDVWLDVEVLPEFRRTGIGSALYERLCAMAAADGRSVQQAYIVHKKVESAKMLPSPTGFGSVPGDNPETLFLLRHGFALEQIERISRLPLPMNAVALAASIAEAAEAAGSDYQLVRWAGRTPAKWMAEVAQLHQRMSTDAPSAGMDFIEEKWDEDRVRALDDARDASPRTMLVVTAHHLPTGTFAGFTELFVPRELERVVDQHDTLVLKEHRGHKLGLLLKLANLQYLAATHPGHPAVMTFNAEENRPMLDVNEAIGFEPVGYGGGWKKNVTESRKHTS